VRVRLGVSAGFLGLLVAFFIWAIYWAVGDFREATYGMPGGGTWMPMYEGQRIVSDAEVSDAQGRLVDFLRDNEVSLVVASDGDGFPQLTVFDEARHMSWATPLAALKPGDGSVFLVADTYSARRWEDSRVKLLLPPGVSVAGVLSVPSSGGDLQFVQPLPAKGMYPGKYLFSTTDETTLRELRELLAEQGLEAQGVQQVPWATLITHNPLVAITALFVLLGSGSAVAQWSVGVGSRARELTIRRRHGARLVAVVMQWFRRGLPPIAIGVAVGVAGSGAVVALVGRRSLDATQYQALALSVGAGLVLTAILWFVVMWAVVRSRDVVRRAE